MKYYRELVSLSAFTLDDAGKVMKNPANASQQLNAMIKAGYVTRIKHNLYTCIDLVSGGEVANHFVIASHITDNSFVAYHSAFEFYGMYNQVYTEIQVASKKRFANFETDYCRYRCFLTDSDAQVETIRGARVTSLERTIVDSIDMLGKVMDVEELVKCLALIHTVDQNKLMDILKLYDKEVLFRKTGYFLSFFQEQYRLKDSFFEFCKANADFTHRGKISSNELNKLTYIKEWALYGYKDIFALTYKGGKEDV
ncbi:MAG: transcriptional regulator [Bacilli bacterium]|nr:transcriptional regulator [Bacilli bacterium]